MNTAYATGDDVPPRALITNTCTCVKVLDNLKLSTAYGDKIHSSYEIIGVSAHDLSGDLAGVTVSYNIPVNTIEDRTGATVKRFPPVKNAIKELTLRRVGSEWLIANVVTYK
jgi:hypothetical protein